MDSSQPVYSKASLVEHFCEAGVQLRDVNKSTPRIFKCFVSLEKDLLRFLV